MQLLSIENLSIAAEATVALLLLALAWQKKSSQREMQLAEKR